MKREMINVLLQIQFQTAGNGLSSGAPEWKNNALLNLAQLIVVSQEVSSTSRLTKQRLSIDTKTPTAISEA